MRVIELILHSNMLPFAIALGVVAGMLVLELVMIALGASLLGGEPDAELDAGFDGDLDFDTELDADVDADFDTDLDFDPEFDVEADIDLDLDAPATPLSEPGGLSAALSWLGLGTVPLSIWLAGMLTAFGLSGYLLQLGISLVFGAPAPLSLAVPVALLPGIALGSRFARLVGRIMPKTESTAISRRSFGRRRGVITVGTARRGQPAQARFRDGHGNTHYALVEPLDDAEELTQGAEIAILRLRDGKLRAILLDD